MLRQNKPLHPLFCGKSSHQILTPFSSETALGEKKKNNHNWASPTVDGGQIPSMDFLGALEFAIKLMILTKVAELVSIFRCRSLRRIHVPCYNGHVHLFACQAMTGSSSGYRCLAQGHRKREYGDGLERVSLRLTVSIAWPRLPLLILSGHTQLFMIVQVFCNIFVILHVCEAWERTLLTFELNMCSFVGVAIFLEGQMSLKIMKAGNLCWVWFILEPDHQWLRRPSKNQSSLKVSRSPRNHHFLHWCFLMEINCTKLELSNHLLIKYLLWSTKWISVHDLAHVARMKEEFIWDMEHSAAQRAH